MVRVIPRRAAPAIALLLAGCSRAVGDGDGVVDADEVPGVGWIAEIEGHHHDVGGTAVIVDEATIEIADFHYDGGGLTTRIYLLADGEDFRPDYALTDDLVGQVFDGEVLVLPIPEHARFEDWNLITLWCVPAAVSFGDGVFSAPD